jgi:hypothetical protein
MRKEIVVVLVLAVLLLGGVAAVFENVSFNSWKMPVFDPIDPRGGGSAIPNGDPLPPGPPM